MAYYCGNLSHTDFLLTLIRIYYLLFFFNFFIAILTFAVSLGCSTSPHP